MYSLTPLTSVPPALIAMMSSQAPWRRTTTPAIFRRAWKYCNDIKCRAPGRQWPDQNLTRGWGGNLRHRQQIDPVIGFRIHPESTGCALERHGVAITINFLYGFVRRRRDARTELEIF